MSALLGEPSFCFELCRESMLLPDFFRLSAAFNSAVSTKDPAEPTLHWNGDVRMTPILESIQADWWLLSTRKQSAQWCAR